MTKQEQQLREMHDRVETLIKERLAAIGAVTPKNALRHATNNDEFLNEAFRARTQINELIDAAKEVA